MILKLKDSKSMLMKLESFKNVLNDYVCEDIDYDKSKQNYYIVGIDEKFCFEYGLI